MKATEQDLREFSKLAGRAMNAAYQVIETVSPEIEFEGEMLTALLNELQDLVNQSYVLNGVMSAEGLKALEGTKP